MASTWVYSAPRVVDWGAYNGCFLSSRELAGRDAGRGDLGAIISRQARVEQRGRNSSQDVEASLVWGLSEGSLDEISKQMGRPKAGVRNRAARLQIVIDRDQNGMQKKARSKQLRTRLTERLTGAREIALKAKGKP